MSQSQYATSAELQALAITPAAATRFGATAVTASLQAASSVADSYLASQFTLPLITSPQGWDMSLTIAVCNIAAWYLYNQFGFSPMAPGDDLVVTRYKSALEWLGQIQKHEISPQFTDSSAENVGSDRAGTFMVSDPCVGFTDRGVDTTFESVGGPWWWW